MPFVPRYFRSIVRVALPFVAALAVACGPEPPDDDDPPPGGPCDPGPTPNFAVGMVISDNPRWFRPFADGCDTVELETGLQGGWHIEPALQAPPGAVQSNLAGEIRWNVADETGATVATAQVEMFDNFWSELEGGLAYWGDFVIFASDPSDLVSTDLTITVDLDFADDSPREDLTLTETVTLVDEEEMTNFR